MSASPKTPATDQGWTAHLRTLLAKPVAGRRLDKALGGGLYVRVEASSAVFFCRWADPSGAQVRHVLGHFVEGPAAVAAGVPGFGVTEARASAAALRGAVANGIDPRASKSASAASETTLGEAYALYKAQRSMKDGRQRRESTKKLDDMMWAHVERAGLDRRRLRDLTAHDVAALRDDITARARASKQARATGSVGSRVASLVSRVVAWSISHKKLPITNAVGKIERAEGVVVQARKRHLVDEELGLVWRALEQREENEGALAGLSISACRAFAVALTTGLRIGEIINLTRADIDLDKALVHVRFGKTENAIRTVPLSAQALGIMTAQVASLPKGQKHVFPATDGRGWTAPAAAGFARTMSAKLGLAELVAFHDARRSAVTLMRQRRVAMDVVQQIVGHAVGDGSVTSTVYDQSRASLDELRDAVERLARAILDAAHPQREEVGGSKIIALRA